jgi:hypothetical protein
MAPGIGVPPARTNCTNAGTAGIRPATIAVDADHFRKTPVRQRMPKPPAGQPPRNQHRAHTTGDREPRDAYARCYGSAHDAPSLSCHRPYDSTIADLGAALSPFEDCCRLSTVTLAEESPILPREVQFGSAHNA